MLPGNSNICILFSALLIRIFVWIKIFEWPRFLRIKGIDHWYDEAKWIGSRLAFVENGFPKIYKGLFLINRIKLTKILTT
jgi:hypothetical protein